MITGWHRKTLCELFLCALYKHTKVNQLFGDAEGKPLTSVMNFCSKPNPIKIKCPGTLFFLHPGEHRKTCNSECLFFLMHWDSSDWLNRPIQNKFWCTESERTKERERIIWGQGCLLGNGKFSHGWREGPGKGLLNSYKAVCWWKILSHLAEIPRPHRPLYQSPPVLRKPLVLPWEYQVG